MSDGDAPKTRLSQPFVERAAFFGRSDELQEVTTAFAGGWRLVTLAGPPGIGKTRLARRAVQEIEREAAAFVDLADVRTRDGLVAAVAAALEVSLAAEGRGAAVTAVGRALARARRTLLVLDNFEQLAAEADLLALWLDEAPGVRFLVTSRARLRLPGERVVELGPLSVASGVALFEERARGPLGRALTDDERAAAERVVRRLDGIPLAIELAAGRATTLGIPDVLARLERGLDVLHTRAGGAPGTSARHHSARAAVAWSWDLLSDAEKRALAQASVFRGGFVLETAEQVLDLESGAVMDAIQGLRERSLLWAVRERGGLVRFGLFEIVRDFAAPLLDAGAHGVRADVERRHARATARRAAELASRAAHDDDRSGGRAATDAFDLLAAEADNLDAAFMTAAGDPDAGDVCASLALSLSTLFRRRGARATHEEVLVRGIEAARACGRTDVESDLLQARAALASAAGEIGVALECQGRALALAERMADASRRVFARSRRGWDRFELGDVDAGLADMRAAVDEAVRLRDAAREAYARNRAGLALFLCGSTTSGIEELARAATLASQTRDRWLRQKTLVELAHAHRRLGSVDQAAQRLVELDALGAPLDEATRAAVRLEHAALARTCGHADDALRILDDAIGRADDAGALRHRVLLRAERAAALVDLGRGGDALAVLDESLALSTRVENPAYRATVLVELSRARLDLGDPDGARAALDLATSAMASARDAALAGTIHLERAVLTGAAGDACTHADLDEALAALQRVGGKPLILALSVSGLLDVSRSDERRAAAEALLPRFADAEARAAVGALRGQPNRDTALGRRLGALHRGRSRREMLVGTEARFYEIDGARVSLQRQRSLRLILLALVEQAERAPGVGLSQAEVVARGWPGEKMRPDSGATRVYTSIRRLRRGGLSGVIITRDDGYLLDPTVALRRS